LLQVHIPQAFIIFGFCEGQDWGEKLRSEEVAFSSLSGLINFVTHGEVQESWRERIM
jgi:hypothetical protein